MTSLASEYADAAALRTRIDTHNRYSEHHDDPGTAVQAALQLVGDETLADIGCGDARFLANLVAAGHRGQLVGIDISPTMVAAAAAITGAEGLLADATRIPLLDNIVDVSTCRHMLYHLSDPLAALGELRRITRAGGQVVVTVNVPDTCRRTDQLIASHARRHGIAAPAGMMNPNVDADTIADMMTTVFGSVTVDRRDNALVFTEPNPVVRWAESLFAFHGIAADDPRRKAVLADITTKIEDWFRVHSEPWRDAKGYAVAISRC